MSDWLKLILNELSQGRRVQLVGRGNSMYPKIKDGETITITPIDNNELKINDIVFVRIAKKYLTHQILKIENGLMTISNIKGKIDGIVSVSSIYGIVTRVGGNEKFEGLTVLEI